jgi:hypothetical protein
MEWIAIFERERAGNYGLNLELRCQQGRRCYPTHRIMLVLDSRFSSPPVLAVFNKRRRGFKVLRTLVFFSATAAF